MCSTCAFIICFNCEGASFIQFLQSSFLELCVHLEDAMTSLLYYWLASSGDLSTLFLVLLTVVNRQRLEFGKQTGWSCKGCTLRCSMYSTRS